MDSKENRKEWIKWRAGSLRIYTKNYKSLARLIKRKKERTQISKIRNERREVITDTTEIQWIQQNATNNYMQQIRQPKRNGHISRNIQDWNHEA